jgi:hypothetical protein
MREYSGLLRYLPIVLAVALGCSSEPEKKPEKKPEAKKGFLELKIQSPALRVITVDPDGSIADILTPTRATGKLSAADLKTLQDLASAVEWDKIPAEGFKTADGKPAGGGRTYDLTYFMMSPAKTVHSMDGAAEGNFGKLRDAIEVDANKIGR